MKTEITYIKYDITEIKDILKQHVKSEDEKFDKIDSKYAEKDRVKALEKKVDNIDSNTSFKAHQLVPWAISVLAILAMFFS